MSKKINEKTETEEEHSELAEPQNGVRTEQSVSKDLDSSIDLESDINLERGRHKEYVHQDEVQKEDAQKESVWQEQKCHNQHK